MSMSTSWKEPEIPNSDEDLFGEEQQAVEITDPLLVFRLAAEWFALPGMKIQEVVRVTEIRYVPGVSTRVAGVTNVRGTIMFVIDMKQLLGLPNGPVTRDSRIIVASVNDAFWGLLVDEVLEVICIPVNSLQPPPVILEPEMLKMIEKTFYWKTRLVALLHRESLHEHFN